MTRAPWVAIFWLGIALGGCSDTGKPTVAEWVFEGGKIFTAEPENAWADALAVADGRIVYVGTGAGVQKYKGKTTQVIDIDEGLLIPGFMDSHNHIFFGSFVDVGPNLSLADTPEKFQATLEAIRDTNPGTGPILAQGWQHHLFPTHGPLASQLDAVFGDRMVILVSVDGHSTSFSSRALREAGVDANFVDPKPGISFFERDPATNAPLGTAREWVGEKIREDLMPGERDVYQARLAAWLPRAAAAGLTSVVDAWSSAPTEEDAYEILNGLEAEGRLHLRVFGSVVQEAAPREMVARFKEFKSRYSSDLVRPEAVKLFADGGPEAHTSFLLTPYVDRPGEDYGEPMMTKADLTDHVTTYFEADIPVHVHAVGDGAVRMTLDAIADARRATGNQEVRATIAHMDYVSPEDVPRFGALGVTAQTSIHFATRDPSYFFLADFVGTQKVESAYPTRTLMEAGANHSFGTDWPASIFLTTYKPLTSIEVAVTRRLPGNTEMPRRNPDESITLAEAITAMTRNTAIQVGELERLGTLAVGKYADLVLLEKDLFEVAPETIHTVPVRMTMLGGEPVYRRGAPVSAPGP